MGREERFNKFFLIFKKFQKYIICKNINIIILTVLNKLTTSLVL